VPTKPTRHSRNALAGRVAPPGPCRSEDGDPDIREREAGAGKDGELESLGLVACGVEVRVAAISALEPVLVGEDLAQGRFDPEHVVRRDAAALAGLPVEPGLEGGKLVGEGQPQ